MAIFSAKELLQRHGISYVESRKGKYTTGCPHCSDNYLSVEIKRDGVVWFCQSCQQGNGEKFEQGSDDSGLGPIKAVYDYLDESGKLLFQVLRFEPVNGAKQFRQRTGPDQEKWSIKGVRIVPFHLPELLEAVGQGQVVFVVEGEKDVLTLARLGIVATCNPMGAKKWRREFGELLRGADVVIVVDNDEPGHEHGRLVAENLIGVAKRVRLLDLAPFWPDIGPSDDISDWVEAGLGALQLWAMIEELPTLERAPQLTNGRDQSPARELLLPLASFVASFAPPAYVADGILQRGYLYSLTARTNHGKTTIAMFLAMCIDRAVAMHGREVMGGTVLFLAGENADDIRARFLVAADYYGFDLNASRIRVIDGVINLEQRMADIVAETQRIDDLVLVIVDTAAAYFPGDDTNSNSQQAAYARLLRELTLLRGKPTVLVNCHPIKNAPRDNLLPMGGSAFLNEVDGNLTLWADDKQVVLHWQGKFRGPEFEPLAFELARAESPRVVDAKGRPMPSVVALPIADVALEAGDRKRQDEENKVLWVLARNPRASFSLIAQKCEFMADGREQKTRVHRIVARLAADKLVTKHRGRYRLSGLGRKELGLKDKDDD